MRLLALVTDAFGGRGGIAKFNRDLLTALCLHPDVVQVTTLPRLILEDPGVLPMRLVYERRATAGKAAYLHQFAKLLAGRNSFDAIVCAHLHLLPFAAIASRRYHAPLVLTIHGIDAWTPPRTWGLHHWFRDVSSFVSVSRLTKERFLQWAPLSDKQGYVVPNCVDFSKYRPGPMPTYLLKRYGLFGRRVLMTVARLSSPDRHKGVDEVLEVIPSLVQEIPNLLYLVVGDGSDRPRLEAKAATLGIAEHVLFAGYVAEEEKADHYRVADAFAMTGRCEGFGIVYLEAMACGVPVVASKADASREALLEGKLGQIVDPDNPNEIRSAIRQALGRPRVIPQGLDYFSFERFVERWHAVLNQTLPALGSLSTVPSLSLD